jgi:ribosomal protein S18 acetylase RimI-like enzyme
VVPEHRRYGVATLLLGRGEAWMRAHRLATAVTFTDEGNVRLIRLYEKHGYRVVETKNQMVKIEKALDRPDHAG